MDIEFNVGDKVTFTPYLRGQEMLVRSISIGNPHIKDKKDTRVFYHLAVSRKAEVTSVTTGKCIEESKLFEKEERI